MRKNKHEVVVQEWEESELDWGRRPDGYSFHLTEKDRQHYIREYWDEMPESVPDIYSRPCGKPYKAIVDAETFSAVKASKNGLRKFVGRPPRSGKSNGWILIR